MKVRGHLVMIKYLLFSMLCLLPISVASAAPSITGISGTLTNGQTVSIAGSSFGTNAAAGTSNIEWLGGASGPIQSGTVGATFTRANWDADWYDNDSTPSAPKKIANDQYHSGTKSLKVIVQPATLWDGVSSYKLPSPSNTVFISYWVRHDTSVTDGQWKMLRVSSAKTIVDGSAIAFFNWYGYQTLVEDTRIPQSDWVNQNCFPAADNNWYRFDVWFNDTTITTTRWLSGSAPVSCTTTGPLNSTSGWNPLTASYIIWQDYIGNSQSNNSSATSIWQSDNYIQNGTQARVELCDAATWASAQHCEIQYPLSWNNTTIQVQLNTGSFSSNATAYLFAIDASGNASAGQQITIGSSGTSGTVVPNPPLLQ